MDKKTVNITDFTRTTFEQFLADYLKDTYIIARDKIGRELEEKRIKSSPEGFLDYLKSQEQEILAAKINLPYMTIRGLTFLYANEIDTPETDWKAEYLKAIGRKGLNWFNDYVDDIWREVRQNKIHQLIFRLSMNKDEFQRRLAEQFRLKMKSAERTLRKKIEGRQSRVDSPSFLTWLREEREKILNSPELDTDDQVTHYADESPEQNAQSFVSTVEFISHPFPIDWWEMWENAMPFLSNFEARQNQNWKWKNTLMQLIKAVDVAVRVKVFTEFIESGHLLNETQTKQEQNAARPKTIKQEELAIFYHTLQHCGLYPAFGSTDSTKEQDYLIIGQRHNKRSAKNFKKHYLKTRPLGSISDLTKYLSFEVLEALASTIPQSEQLMDLLRIERVKAAKK